MKAIPFIVGLLLPAASLLWTAGSRAESPAAPFEVTSASFADGARLPSTRFVHDGHGCSGANLSPEVSWRGAPKGTRSYAVTLFDRDAGGGRGWWHWIVFDIPASVDRLPEGAGQGASLPAGTVQGTSDFGEPGYQGPCPPEGDAAHHYVLTVYALDSDRLDLGETAKGVEASAAFKPHTLASDSITFLYERP